MLKGGNAEDEKGFTEVRSGKSKKIPDYAHEHPFEAEWLRPRDFPGLQQKFCDNKEKCTFKYNCKVIHPADHQWQWYSEGHRMQGSLQIFKHQEGSLYYSSVANTESRVSSEKTKQKPVVTKSQQQAPPLPLQPPAQPSVPPPPRAYPPPQGFPPQGYPQFPPQGFPPQGYPQYPPQVYIPQGYMPPMHPQQQLYQDIYQSAGNEEIWKFTRELQRVKHEMSETEGKTSTLLSVMTTPDMSEEMNKNLHKSLDDLLAKNRDLAKTKGDLEKTIDDELHKLKTQEAANAKKRNEDQQTSREPTKIQKSSTSRGGRTRSQRRS